MWLLSLWDHTGTSLKGLAVSNRCLFCAFIKGIFKIKKNASGYKRCKNQWDTFWPSSCLGESHTPEQVTVVEWSVCLAPYCGSPQHPVSWSSAGAIREDFPLYLRLELSLNEASKRWGGAPGVCVEGWGGMSCKSMGQSQKFLLVVPWSRAGKNVLEVTSDVHVHMVSLTGLCLPSWAFWWLLSLNSFSDPPIRLPCLLKLPWDRTLPGAL